MPKLFNKKEEAKTAVTSPITEKEHQKFMLILLSMAASKY